MVQQSRRQAKPLQGTEPWQQERPQGSLRTSVQSTASQPRVLSVYLYYLSEENLSDNENRYLDEGSDPHQFSRVKSLPKQLRRSSGHPPSICCRCMVCVTKGTSHSSNIDYVTPQDGFIYSTSQFRLHPHQALRVPTQWTLCLHYMALVKTLEFIMVSQKL